MRVSIVGIYVTEQKSAPELNAVLHEYYCFVEGRFGLPKVKEGLNVITLVFQAPKNEIEEMIEKLNAIEGVKAEAHYEYD